MSLLSKFPGQYSLIEDILVKSQRMAVVNDVSARADVMELILSQQRQQDAASENVPTPSMQEYMLRSQPDHQHAPCQLTARLGKQRGLLIALSRCDRS